MLWTEAHATHVATAAATHGLRGLWLVGNDSLGGEEQACDGRGVQQRGTRHLDRVVDASGKQGRRLAGRGVEAVTIGSDLTFSTSERRPRGRR